MKKQTISQQSINWSKKEHCQRTTTTKIHKEESILMNLYTPGASSQNIQCKNRHDSLYYVPETNRTYVN